MTTRAKRSHAKKPKKAKKATEPPCVVCVLADNIDAVPPGRRREMLHGLIRNAAKIESTGFTRHASNPEPARPDATPTIGKDGRPKKCMICAISDKLATSLTTKQRQALIHGIYLAGVSRGRETPLDFPCASCATRLAESDVHVQRIGLGREENTEAGGVH